MLTAYFITVMIVCAFLSYVWSNNSWLNVWIKFTLITLTGWSIFNVLQHLGYIVKGVV